MDYSSILNCQSVSSILHDISDTERINLNPAYQRDIVWDADKQSTFINSVLKGIVPMNIVFNKDEKTGRRVCIDGKQRLTSLKLFVKNKIPVVLDQETYYYDNIPKDTEELDPKILPEHIKNKFLDVQLHVCTYLNLSYQDQIEIFWRLQNGVSTKLSEKFVALFSSEEDCNTFNKLCEKQYEHIKKFAKDIHRKDHCLLIAELLFITKFDRIETSWTSKNITKNLLNIFKESDLEKTKIFRRLELAIKYLFSPKLLNHDAISHRINKNKLYVIIYKINKKYSSKWDNLTDDECKKIRQVIIKLKKEPESIKIKYETTNKVLIKIAELYDKYYSMNDDKKYSESSDEHTSDDE